jgi:hypothetical protein
VSVTGSIGDNVYFLSGRINKPQGIIPYIGITIPILRLTEVFEEFLLSFIRIVCKLSVENWIMRVSTREPPLRG